MKASRFLLICGMITPLLYAQDVRPLVRSLELQKLAEERESKCDWAGAQSFYEAMGKALKQPTGNTLTEAGAGLSEADLQDRLNKLRKRRDETAKNSRKAAELLKQGQAEASLDLWRRNDGPACDAELGRSIEAARNHASELKTQGDLEQNARRRLQLYTDAFHLDSQLPGLYKDLSETRVTVNSLPCNACRTAGKTVKTILIVGGLAAGAYFGYKEYQKYEASHSGACTAGSVCH